MVSSSLFRLRSLPSWAQVSGSGAAYSAIDWDAQRGVVAVGTSSGALGMRITQHKYPDSGGDGPSWPLRGSAPGWGGVPQQDDDDDDEGEGEERVRWRNAAPSSMSQVSWFWFSLCRVRLDREQTERQTRERKRSGFAG